MNTKHIQELPTTKSQFGLLKSKRFVSILLGTIAGGVLSQLSYGPLWVGLAVSALAASGWLVSR